MKAGSTAQNVNKRHVMGQRMCRNQRIAEADQASLRVRRPLYPAPLPAVVICLVASRGVFRLRARTYPRKYPQVELMAGVRVR